MATVFPAVRMNISFVIVGCTERETMLVERGLQVLNVEAVGDAYAIASNYLRRTGADCRWPRPNERLLEIIVELFQRGEYNKIRLANKAIPNSKHTCLPDHITVSAPPENPWKPRSTESCRPTTCL